MVKKLSAKQKKLAAFAPPRNKITRADIITAAKNKAGKNGSKKRPQSRNRKKA